MAGKGKIIRCTCGNVNLWPSRETPYSKDPVPGERWACPPCPEVIYPEASVSLSSPRNVWTHTLTIYYNATPWIGGDLHLQILRVLTPFPLLPPSPIIGDAYAAHAKCLGLRHSCGSGNPGRARPIVQCPGVRHSCGSRNPRIRVRPIVQCPGVRHSCGSRNPRVRVRSIVQSLGVRHACGSRNPGGRVRSIAQCSGVRHSCGSRNPGVRVRPIAQCPGLRHSCGSRNPGMRMRPIAKCPGCVVPGIQRERPSDA